jgi:hypothetical protein
LSSTWTFLRLAVALCSTLASVAASAQTGAAAGAITWSADRPLQWSDFAGPVNPTAPFDTVAMTAASLNWTYSYQLERSSRRCVFRITEITTEALFHPEDSWARPEHRTAVVLEHEQGHFDLTHVHKLMLDREATALVGDERSCGRRASTAADVESRVAEAIRPLRERIWRDLQRVQAEYDASTRHGILVDAQRQWTARIREALRRGRWE